MSEQSLIRVTTGDPCAVNRCNTSGGGLVCGRRKLWCAQPNRMCGNEVKARAAYADVGGSLTDVQSVFTFVAHLHKPATASKAATGHSEAPIFSASPIPSPQAFRSTATPTPACVCVCVYMCV